MAVDLRLSILVSALKNEKKDHFIALIKNIGLIKKLINKNLHFFLNNKTAAKIKTILKDSFQYIFPISVIFTFFNTFNMKLLNYKNVVNYTSCYQIAFNKILSLINKNKDL